MSFADFVARAIPGAGAQRMRSPEGAATMTFSFSKIAGGASILGLALAQVSCSDARADVGSVGTTSEELTVTPGTINAVTLAAQQGSTIIARRVLMLNGSIAG